MKSKRNALRGICIIGAMLLICFFGNYEVQAPAAETVQAAVVAVHTDDSADNKVSGTPTAGVSAYLAMVGEDLSAAEAAQMKTDIVAAAEETAEEENAWQNRLLANVDEFLYVRADGDADAEIVGKLYKGDAAEIVETGDTWTHITSGQVDGFVKNEYCLYGADAMEYANANFEATAEIQTDGLRIRSSADADGNVITFASEGMILLVDTSVETSEDWIAVRYEGNTGYVSAEYVETGVLLGEAITIEEEQAEEAAAQAAREAEAAARAANEEAKITTQTAVVETVQRDAVSASYDDVTLLAALIQCEAGSEPYEGQVAVGAVVMNRIRSGAYSNNLYDVIYQPNQFTPAGRGDVAAAASRGPKASCIQAAQEALSGVDNTGGATCFRRASSGQAGYVIGNHVFF